MIRSFIFGIVILFGLAIALPIIGIIWGDLNTAFQGEDVFPTVAKDSFDTQATAYNSVWDYTFLIVLFAIVAGLISLAYVLPTNPVLMFVIILIITIMGLLAGFLANAWGDVTSGTNAYSAAVAGFPIMNFVVTYYLHFTIAIGFIVLVVFYAKPNQEGVF